jgi:hypothetical protein
MIRSGNSIGRHNSWRTKFSSILIIVRASRKDQLLKNVGKIGKSVAENVHARPTSSE